MYCMPVSKVAEWCAKMHGVLSGSKMIFLKGCFKSSLCYLKTFPKYILGLSSIERWNHIYKAKMVPVARLKNLFVFYGKEAHLMQQYKFDFTQESAVRKAERYLGNKYSSV